MENERVALELLQRSLDYSRVKNLSIEDSSKMIFDAYSELLEGVEWCNGDLNFEDGEYECDCCEICGESLDDCEDAVEVFVDSNETVKVNIIGEDGNITDTVYLEVEQLD